MSLESSHWYDEHCKAVFEVPNKSKPGNRPTTIKDARALKLLPSVTTVLSVLARPQLDRWKLEQVAKACYVRRKDAEPIEIDAYVSTMIDKAFEQVEEAADLGTDIHAALENHFQGRPYDEKLKVYVEAVDAWCKKEEVVFEQHELRLVSKSHGYAGTTDAVMRSKWGRGILDFKSRKTYPGKAVTPYDTQPMQIAAYDIAYYSTLPDKDRVGVNVYISTTEPGRIDATWYNHEQLCQEWRAFAATMEIWRHLKSYDPRIV